MVVKSVVLTTKLLIIEDDTVCFFLHDDLIIKDWNFIPICLEKLNTFKVVGNCRDYAEVGFNPFKVTEIFRVQIS